MNFFGTPHCESKAHCKTCRAPVAGRAWRENMRKAFADIPATDFDCPHNKPWAELPDPDQPYKEAKTAIEAAPDEGLWTELKTKLIEVESGMLPNDVKCGGSCAKNKARARLVMAYKQVKGEK